MKKTKCILCLLLSMVLLCCISGCANDELAGNHSKDEESSFENITTLPTGETLQAMTEITVAEEVEATSQPYLDMVTNQPILLAEIPTLPAAGGENFILKKLAPFDKELLERVESDVYPIYLNQYPVGEHGPMFEITEEFLAAEEESLQTYLTLLYGEGEYKGIYRPDVTYKLMYEDQNISLFADTRSVTLDSTAYPVYNDLNTDDLTSNPLMSAALAYSSIKNPVITCEVEYDVYAEPSCYIYVITEQTDDPFADACNSSFSYVRIRSMVEGNILLITAVHLDNPEQVGMTTLATEQEVDAYLAEAYPEVAKKNYEVELYYSTTAYPGYYVPCYQVVVEEIELYQQYSVPAYTVLQLTDSRFLSQSSDDGIEDVSGIGDDSVS